MHYLWTILILAFTVLWYGFYAWASNWNGEEGASKWAIFLTFAIGALCPFWLILSRYTKNMWRDALWYDIAMALGFYGGMLILGYNDGLSVQQKFASAMIIGGILLFHWK